MATLYYKGSVFAVLPAYTRLFNSSIFSRADDAPESDYDFTAPVEVALTEDVIKKLNYPNHIATNAIGIKYQMFLQKDQGGAIPVTVMITGIDTGKRSCTLSMIGNYGGYNTIVGNKRVTELSLGGDRILGGISGSSDDFEIDGNSKFNIKYYAPDSDVFDKIKALMNESEEDDFVFYQALDEKSNIPVLDLDVSRHCLNRWAPYVSPSLITPFLMDPVLTNIQCALDVNSDTFTDRFFWVPFFRLYYVMKCCFEEFGFEVLSELEDDDKFKRITLYNTYSISKCSFSEAVDGSNVYTATITHDATTIHGGNHMPDMSITEFLWEIAKKFNLRYIINFSNNTVVIQKLDRINITTEILDITGFCDPDYIINNENPLNFKNGYKLAYTFDPNDSVQGTRVDENLLNNTDNIIYPTDNYNTMLAIDTTGFTSNDYAFVRSENAYYQWSGTEWVFSSDNLMSRTTTKINNEYVFYGGVGELVYDEAGTEAQAITTKAAPMVMKYADNMFLGANEDYFNYVNVLVPYSSLGVAGEKILQIKKPADITSGDGHDFLGTFTFITVPRISIMPHLCNWIGMQYAHFITANAKQPCGSVTNITIDGTEIDCYSLSWALPYTAAGIYFHFWQSWTKTLKNSICIDNDVLLDAESAAKFDPEGTLIKKEGQAFVVVKAEINEQLPSVSKLTMVRI